MQVREVILVKWKKNNFIGTVKGVILITSFTVFSKKVGINYADKISYILITII